MQNRLLPAAILCVSLCAAGYALDVGDKAPPVKVSKWLVGKGVDPTTPASNRVCVVEIWATWCPPCRITIPHINRLHAKLKDKGVVIMAISAEEADTVEAFLKTTPMNYNVGIDNNQATSKAYSSEDGGVPRAFVIGGDGKVVWAGHPLDGMDRVLGRLAAGTFDPKKLAQAAQLEKEVQASVQLSDMAGVKATIDKLLQLDSDNPKYYVLKVALLVQSETPDLEAAKAAFAAWAKGCAEYDAGLRMLVSAMLEQDYALRDPELIMSSATKAVALSGGNDPEIALMMSGVYAEFGMLDQAIETLKKGMETADPESKKRMAVRLEYYTKAKRLAK
jgi:thiol-disulfide isomerase/thioredoxin